MTRKDIIIVAVLTNIAVLSILFMLAFHSEQEPENSTENIYTIVEEKPIQENKEGIEIDLGKMEPIDEVDAALEEITPMQSESAFNQEDDFIQYSENIQSPKESVSSDKEQSNRFEQLPGQKYVEIMIKKGDVLEKIAKANGTTVEAIMKSNELKNDRLKIGQVLKVPLNTIKTSSSTSSTITKSPNLLKNVASHENATYTMKSGDNLWKVAKQYRISVDELLRLNNLDEDSARKLKIGDQIRTR